jgi:Flp pilus assembly pilin Flp
LGLPAKTVRILFLVASKDWDLTRLDAAEPQEAEYGKTGRGQMTRKAIRAVRALLLDESGQTMLEYIVIVVFVVIAAIIGFRLVKGIVYRSVSKASASIEQ